MLRIVLAICGMMMFLAGQARADWDTTRPSTKVAVVPFTVHGDAGHEWMGNAIQEGLATGLNRVAGVIISGSAPQDAAAAVNMAKYTGADAVVFGSIQVVDGQIRISGQIISIESGDSLGSIRSDGSERDLFSIEDIMAARVERIVNPPSTNRAASGGPPVLQVVGPSISPGPSRYFDGNLMSQINPPARDRDEYNKYYYYSSDTSCYGTCFGASCGGYGFVSAPLCGVVCPTPAYPVHGW